MNLESKVWFSFSYSAVEKTGFRLSAFTVATGIEGKQSFCGISLLLLSLFLLLSTHIFSPASSMIGYPFGGHCYGKLPKYFEITYQRQSAVGGGGGRQGIGQGFDRLLWPRGRAFE